MALRNRLTVRKKNGDEREGRGFSREELRKSGVSLNQALRIGLPVDARRRTVHDENVKRIKLQLKSFKTAKKRASKPKKKTS